MPSITRLPQFPLAPQPPIAPAVALAPGAAQVAQAFANHVQVGQMAFIPVVVAQPQALLLTACQAKEKMAKEVACHVGTGTGTVACMVTTAAICGIAAASHTPPALAAAVFGGPFIGGGLGSFAYEVTKHCLR